MTRSPRRRLSGSPVDRAVAAVLLCAAMAPPFLAAPVPAAAQERAAGAAIEDQARAVVDLLNDHRRAAGLAPLTVSAPLETAAAAHSADMLRSDRLSHDGSDGSSFIERVQKAGYGGYPRGENVGLNYRSAEAAVAGWLGSAGHRRNIEEPAVRDVGVGLVIGPDGRSWWTVLFGQPR